MKRREFVRLVGGALAIAPGIARAQSGKRIPTVGYLWHAGSAREEYPYYDAVIEGFARLGCVSGRNIVLEHRFPDEKPERFARMAAELVAIRPNVLMSGQVAVGYLQAATKTIPIVFSFVPDPVRMKLVASLARPGGNITGLANFGLDIASKRLQLLKEIVPELSRVAMLINSNSRKCIHVRRSDASCGLVTVHKRKFRLPSLSENSGEQGSPPLQQDTRRRRVYLCARLLLFYFWTMCPPAAAQGRGYRQLSTPASRA
jgi:putative ABC transport system substrate-binding protein